MGLLYNPTSLEKGIRSEFIHVAQEIAGSPDLAKYRALYSVLPSDSDAESYAWMGQVAALREWVGARVFKDVSDVKYTLTNKKYEGSLAVPRENIEDDKLGWVPLAVRQLATRAMNHPIKLVLDALTAGETGTCYTGEAFFANSHAARGEQTAAQDNLLARTGDTVANITTDFGLALAALRGYKDEANEPFNEMLGQLLVVCGPSLEVNMKTALNAAIVSQTSNVLVSMADTLVTPRITDGSWYLLHLGNPVKPLVFQERVPAEIQAVEQGDTAFTRDEYHYGVRMRGVAAYGFWQDAVKVKA